MKSCIVIAHPYQRSFNFAILDQVKQSLHGEYVVIDLYQEEFDPVLHGTELKDYNRGIIKDPKILIYQDMIRTSDHLIFIFPIWWYGMPAILKGFMDKVLTPGFAFDEDESGLKGKLTHIKHVLAISTSEVTNHFLRTDAGNPIEIAFLDTTLGVCGISQSKVWLNCEHVVSSDDIARQAFLTEIDRHIKTLT
jgi:NAD(P)H dehydrogenase (quinone)